MEDNKKHKQIFFITVLISVLLILIIVYVLIRPRLSPSPDSVVSPSVTPSAIEPSLQSVLTGYTGPGPGSSDVLIDQTTEDMFEAVANLSRIVPYNGRYFSIEYSEPSGNYVVTIQQGNRAEGESEFDTFLKSNKISTREWIPNLVVQYN